MEGEEEEEEERAKKTRRQKEERAPSGGTLQYDTTQYHTVNTRLQEQRWTLDFGDIAAEDRGQSSRIVKDLGEKKHISPFCPESSVSTLYTGLYLSITSATANYCVSAEP